MENSVNEQYEKLEKVGEGTYGKVYKARDRETDQFVALKKTRLEMDEEGVPSTALREVSLLQMLSESDYVVKLLRVEQTADEGRPLLYLAFEYHDTDLKRYMESFGRGQANPLPQETIKSFAFQLCMGVAHIHRHGVMHRDLKPQNLLVDRVNHTIKIADLGLSRTFSIPLKAYTHEIITLWYRAPEVLLGSAQYSTPVDIWSLGCIIGELGKKHPLFPGDSELQQLLHIFKCLGTPSEDDWPGVTNLSDWHEFPYWRSQPLPAFVPQLDSNGIDLVRRLLKYNPASRMHAIDAVNHPFFGDLDKASFASTEEDHINMMGSSHAVAV